MKIITYSDLHLEFGTDFLPPTDSDADLMVKWTPFTGQFWRLVNPDHAPSLRKRRTAVAQGAEIA